MTRTASLPNLLRGVLLALTLVLPLACSSDDSSGSTTTAAADDDKQEVTVPDDLVDLTGQAEVTILVKDNVFEPKAAKISAGTTVLFVNEGRNEHNVTQPDDPEVVALEPNGEPGSEGELAFEDGGTFGYFCSLHGTITAGQNGVLVVEG